MAKKVKSEETTELPVGPEAFEYALADAARLYRSVYNRRSQALHGLTQSQGRALIHLSRNEGTNQARLAEVLEVQPISLARTLDRLEADGWIERRRDPHDRRAFTLHTLEKAGPLLEEMRTFALSLREETLSSLTEEERMSFARLITKVADNLAASEARDQLRKQEQTAKDAAE